MAEVVSLDQEEADMATQDTGQAEATAAKLATLRDDVRATIGRVDDPQLKAVLETGAEVLGGLRQAFVDYGQGSEEAWQR
jgi:erythromycin esterase-like protein